MPIKPLFLLLGCVLATAVAAEVPPVEAFGGLPSTSDVDIAPGGRFLATVQSTDEATIVAVRDLDDAKAPTRATRIEGASPRGVHWANDDTLLLLVSQAQRKATDKGMQRFVTTRWLALDRATLAARALFDHEPGYYVNDAGQLLASGPERPVFARWTSRTDMRGKNELGSRIRDAGAGAGIGLFEVRLDKAKVEFMAGGTAATDRWIVDGDGRAVGRVDSGSDAEGAWLRVWSRQGSGSEISSGPLLRGSEDRPAPTPLGRLADGTWIAVDHIKDRAALVAYDPIKGAAGRPLFAHDDYDLEETIYDTRTASIRGMHFVDDLPRRRFLDADEQRLQDNLAAALPKASPLLWSRSADGKRHVVKVVYHDHPDQWFLFDRGSKRLDMLVPSYKALDGKVVAHKEPFAFTASDGLRIPGYLTVPADAAKGALPLVVLVHGGPWARDDQSFDYWSFFYAARGYLVYQPNFRGSHGYGRAFRDAGDGEWGRKMQSDVSEGLRKLIADGRVDGKRVCIVGASYGGYAALAGATLTPELYACAVSVNGIALPGDLLSREEGGSLSFWEARIGSRFNRDRLREVSPAHHANDARAPILILHGVDDSVVPIGQSRAMAKALKAARKPHELIELEGEDHWLSHAATRIRVLKTSIEFIDRHIGPSAQVDSDP